MIRHFNNYGPEVTVSKMRQLPDLFDSQIERHESSLNVAGVPASVSEINDFSLGKLKRDICLQMNLI